MWNKGSRENIKLLKHCFLLPVLVSILINVYSLNPLFPIQEIYSDGDKIMNIFGWKAVKTINEALISAWNWQKSKNK